MPGKHGKFGLLDHSGSDGSNLVLLVLITKKISIPAAAASSSLTRWSWPEIGLEHSTELSRVVCSISRMFSQLSQLYGVTSYYIYYSSAGVSRMTHLKLTFLHRC